MIVAERSQEQNKDCYAVYSSWCRVTMTIVYDRERAIHLFLLEFAGNILSTLASLFAEGNCCTTVPLILSIEIIDSPIELRGRISANSRWNCTFNICNARVRVSSVQGDHNFPAIWKNCGINTTPTNICFYYLGLRIDTSSPRGIIYTKFVRGCCLRNICCTQNRHAVQFIKLKWYTASFCFIKPLALDRQRLWDGCFLDENIFCSPKPKTFISLLHSNSAKKSASSEGSE
ncbi:hypothetical protein NIES2104_03600 [Leptolyngbya sp. NIES-2104]|nr:hypothetical protein NIES2104_03600 [Leptolyngbya sp. NIES-2104]